LKRASLGLLVVLAAAAPAQASFPGRNGKLAITVQGCNDVEHILAFTPVTAQLRELTPSCESAGRFEYRHTAAPEWFPDGRRLVFLERDRSETPGTTTFRIADANGREMSRISTAGGGVFPRAPSVSPGGTRIAFSGRERIYTVNVDGTGLGALSPDPFCTVAGCAYFEDPRWSPDGRRLAVARGGPHNTKNGIWLMDARNGRLIRRLSKGGHEPDWSPDTRHVVFRSRDNNAGDGGNLFVVRADGKGRPRRIVHRERLVETQPVWSPDGRWIAWVSLRWRSHRAIDASLWRIRLADGRLQRLTTLTSPAVESGMFDAPDVAWQPLRSG
jgi:Tol biopolymer transport system component